MQLDNFRKKVFNFGSIIDFCFRLPNTFKVFLHSLVFLNPFKRLGGEVNKSQKALLLVSYIVDYFEVKQVFFAEWKKVLFPMSL